MKRLVIILFLASMCCGRPFVLLAKGDVYTSHQNPITDSTLDIGSVSLLWRYIYGDSFTDGTALWDTSSLSGFISIEGTTLTDGTFIVSGGNISVGTWLGTPIDISDYTNLVAGTNITLLGDTLNVDDAFLINDGDDTTTGVLTMNGLIVGSDPPVNITSAGTAGAITWDSDYLYVCIAANSWKRVAIDVWGVAGDTMIYEDSNTMLYEDGNTMIFD